MLHHVMPSGGAQAPDLTRRQLLAAGGAATIALLLTRPLPQLPAGGGAAAGASASSVPPHLLRSSYTDLVGKRFTVTVAGSQRLALELVAVRDLRRQVPGSHEDAFALLFHGPRAPALDHGVHRLRQRTLGSFELLLGRSGTGRRGQDYEAIINRAVPARRN